MRSVFAFRLKNVAKKQLAVLAKLGMELEAERLGCAGDVCLQFECQVGLLHILIGRKRVQLASQLQNEEPVECFVESNFDRLAKLEICECSGCHQW